MTTSEKHRQGKYLTFNLAEEDYGIPIVKVREIIGMTPINWMPQMPDSVKGIINLRDQVIPVVDLRTHFNMPEADYGERTCIILVEVQSPSMLKCWEETECDKTTCPAYNSQDHQCWTITGTHCYNVIQGNPHEKIEDCRRCGFYKTANESKAVATLGVIVDSVSEVMSIREEQIGDVPALNNTLAPQYILGVAKVEGGVKILLDIDRALIDEMERIQEQAA